MSRQGRISERQQSIILDFMESHPDLRRGKFTPQFTAAVKSQYWVQLSHVLNADGLGPSKTEEKWMRTWVDWKSATKAKAARVRYQQNMTGGGPAKEILSVVEGRLMGLMSWHAATGFEDVREGGVELQRVFTPPSTPVAASLPAAAPSTPPSVSTLEATPSITPPNTISSTATPTTEPVELTFTTATTFASPQGTTTPTSRSRKRRRTDATSSTFQASSAAFQRLEEENCIARLGIAQAINRLADSSEQQVQATNRLADSSEQQVQATHAVANALNAIAAAIGNMSRRDV